MENCGYVETIDFTRRGAYIDAVKNYTGLLGRCLMFELDLACNVREGVPLTEADLCLLVGNNLSLAKESPWGVITDGERLDHKLLHGIASGDASPTVVVGYLRHIAHKKRRVAEQQIPVLQEGGRFDDKYVENFIHIEHLRADLLDTMADKVEHGELYSSNEPSYWCEPQFNIVSRRYFELHGDS